MAIDLVPPENTMGHSVCDGCGEEADVLVWIANEQLEPIYPPTVWVCLRCIERARSLVTASMGLGVKRLEWYRRDGRLVGGQRWVAATPFGDYEVELELARMGWLWTADFAFFRQNCDSLDHGKALCQADFDRRVAECLA